MEIRRGSGTPNLMTPLRIWLLSGVTAIAFTAVAVNVWLVPVHAKIALPNPGATLAATAPTLQHAAPVKPKLTLAEQRKALLRGIASWYGDAFDGQTMANGETFDETKMTACHPTLPFGSVVKVKNLRNGRSVIVRITDRGALAAGRILDLSHAAAEKLAMSNAGLAPVVLEVLSRGDGERRAPSY
ncbi:septal ring lytic transglycosylase RlpA family protein [Terracidiphilus gabretensis]|uniref:septal ring lytic transglycosylase RlpA family protein n=1 Tax=Terracidiphilus gabretensis TaxID=1577687 RepID=UPI0009E786FF|nr:septal ring lytic transglycosylase RlpA family protein [Terracidiphilus gabretensis]